VQERAALQCAALNILYFYSPLIHAYPKIIGAFNFRRLPLKKLLDESFPNLNFADEKPVAYPGYFREVGANLVFFQLSGEASMPVFLIRIEWQAKNGVSVSKTYDYPCTEQTLVFFA
jgi:hypothetical protein